MGRNCSPQVQVCSLKPLKEAVSNVISMLRLSASFLDLTAMVPVFEDDIVEYHVSWYLQYLMSKEDYKLSAL